MASILASTGRRRVAPLRARSRPSTADERHRALGLDPRGAGSASRPRPAGPWNGTPIKGLVDGAAADGRPELEADRVADRVMRAPGNTTGCAACAHARVPCARCADEPLSRLSNEGRSLHTDGRPAVSSRGGTERIVIDDNPNPTPSQPRPPARSCPTDVRVVEVGTIELNPDDADAGWLTGWGGYAKMEVSDPSGRDWNGTSIHENLESIRNTCEPTDACPNAGGEGGSAGSTFVIGEGTDLAGLGTLPGERNRFYDVHMFALEGVSYLHALGKNTCTHWCRQHYDCGGRRVGPEFDVNRLMYKDLIIGAGLVHDVTRIELLKSRV